MIKKYFLEGLSCASCASKIQAALKKVNGIKAELNFATGILTTKVADRETEEQIFKIIKTIEPDIRIIPVTDGGANTNETESRTLILKKISYASVFFAMGLLIDYFFLPKAIIGGIGSANFWYVFIPYLLAYAISGQDVLIKAVRNIRKGQFFDENILMSTATLGAFAIKEFPEAVGVMLFFKLGEYLEQRAVTRSRKSIQNLLEIRADYANLIRDGQTEQVSPETVRVGDTIVIRPGEKIPLDGVVIQGTTTVDTSPITGEAMPRTLKEGDIALSGMINQNALIVVRVTKVYSESTVSKILDLVEKAADRKAPTERFITRFSRIYTPIVITLAFLIAVIPPLSYKLPMLTPLFPHVETWSEWIYRALVFLVIACPCALVLSIPIGFFAGVGASAKRGILFKGSNFLEAFRSVHTIVFDKTGTLTEGVFKVIEVKPYNGFTADDVLRVAAVAESHSNHPIASSIIKAYGKNLEDTVIKKYKEIPSHGVRVITEEGEFIVGNDRILHLDGFEIEHENCITEGTVVHVAVNRNYAGYILLADTIREDAITTLKLLKKEGIQEVIMLTGDDSEAARLVSQKLNIDNFYAELLPHEKIEVVKTLEARGKTIAFVGDGINDAPVLMASDIGIAMGGLGSDAAIEAADVVLMKDRLSALVDAILISRKTNNIVKGNIIIVLLVKLFFISLGALGMATMWEAVFADVGVAILAVLNSTRILRL